MAHKWHKEIMAVAEAAKTSDTPWTVLQYRYAERDWQDCWCANNLIMLFSSDKDYEFRIKPRTVTCTLTYPEPLRVKPEMGHRYWLASRYYNSSGDTPVASYFWHDSDFDNLWFNNGRIHLKEEDARAHVEAEYRGSRPNKLQADVHSNTRIGDTVIKWGDDTAVIPGSRQK